ncbi:helix-turn-helix domain-containing protein [Niameybacter massiliensis]|uniref:helix-turn-helix domain-containing protein n=1 Tax=Niameybacter massiliensis TaxID=1658108 RepID=UPI0006B57D3A|nr:helix-turn-helix transcriptional regulator [Niameybacter massiliensis]
MEVTSSEFALRLKELRKENNITQLELSKKLGIVRTAITNYETGRTMPDPITLNALAKIFNVSLDYLMGETNTRNYIDLDHIKPASVKEKVSYDEFMKTAKAFFMDASDEDREAITRDISNLYWESKQINKTKYAPRKKKNS